MSKVHFIVNAQEANERLDRTLVKRFPEHSRSYFHYLFSKSAITHNRGVAQKKTKPQAGDHINIEFLHLPQLSLEPQEIPLDILFEDEHLLAVNKPAGMVVHPAPGNPNGTFANAFLHHLQGSFASDSSLRPGIIHRLDKETSGVLLAAKHPQAHEACTKLFATRQVQKTYLAICLGNPGEKAINQPIGRHPTKRVEMAIHIEGKEAITFCKTIDHNRDFSLVEIHPTTGRTHQIRVHLKSICCPILGDKLYGNTRINAKQKVDRQLLHASHLRLVHPLTHQQLDLSAPIPEDFHRFQTKYSLQYSAVFE